MCKICFTGAIKYEEPDRLSLKKKKTVASNVLTTFAAESIKQEVE